MLPTPMPSPRSPRASYAYALLVFALQNIATPVNMRNLVASEKYFTSLDILAFNIVSVLYGMWNLDFFGTILNGVCLNISTLQVLALDYLCGSLSHAHDGHCLCTS